MKIAVVQYNPMVGDLKGNMSKTIDFIAEAKENNCDLVVFPELSLTGYPPRDLLFRPDFLKACDKTLDALLPHTEGIGVIIGTVMGDIKIHQLYNCALLIENGNVTGRVDKSLLPNYDVFEEARYFQPSKEVKCLDFRGQRLGVSICEDIWNDGDIFEYQRYPRVILDELFEDNPDIFINISASPYYFGKHEIRKNMVSYYADKYQLPFVYVNQIGGNDELVFDGSSMVYDKKGELILHGKSFEEDIIYFDTTKTYPKPKEQEEDISWLYRGLVLGIRDYFNKTGFKKTLLGLSGGLDSALVACILKDALGKENVLGVFMPTRYTTEVSRQDADDLIKNLGIEYNEISIEGLFKEYLYLFNHDGKASSDLAEENIQARIRGNILMFIANREGRVLVCPSNKSEISVGYSTLYGDSCGGIAVIGDILKTRAYELSKYINRDREVIPNNIITKAPTAELRENQKDEDSLPPYPILDGVLELYLEKGYAPGEIIQKGYDRDVVYRIISMVNKAEHKRRQIPPIIRLSYGNFGIGRKHPVVHGYRPEAYEE